MNTTILWGKGAQYGPGGLKRNELAIPKNDGIGCERVFFDLKAYEHKIYPTCPHCAQKYVPIHKGDTLCFKCLMTT